MCICIMGTCVCVYFPVCVCTRACVCVCVRLCIQLVLFLRQLQRMNLNPDQREKIAFPPKSQDQK